MPYNGIGVFTSLGAPIFPAVANTYILASYFNATINDIFTGLSTALTKDGQTTATANIPMGTFKFTGLGVGAASGQALTYDQLAAQLKALTITEELAVIAPVVSFSAAVTATVGGSWNFTTASMLIATQTPGTANTTAASTNFVATAISAAAASIAGGTVSYPAAAYYAAATFGGF